MLINDIVTLKKYLPTVYGDNFTRYENYLSTADNYIIRELTGETIYNNLVDESYGDDVDETLLDLCRNVAANKAYLDAIPMLDLVETETGFGIVSNQNVAPASRERVNALMKGIENRLSDAIEQLLEYLEENSQYHCDWSTANCYAINHDSYIFTLKQFRRYARYEGSRIEWLKDFHKVTQALRYRIETVISAELSNTIIVELQAGSLSEANKLIIEDLRMSLAAFVTGNEITGQNCLNKVRKTLIANVDDYPDFQESDIYIAYAALEDPYSTDHSILNCGV